MNSEDNKAKNEQIELTLPVNAAYVSAVRLTASSISNRMGFQIEDIEDVKAAVSEACIYLINQCRQIGRENFHICFSLEGETLHIRLEAVLNPDMVQSCEEETLGIKMIQALMNELTIDRTRDSIIIHMVKSR